MNIPIVFEDDFLLVINKPAGLVVNRADTTAKVETVQDWLDSRKPKTGRLIAENRKQRTDNQQDILNEFHSRSGIVHRLDKDTSGLLIIAKTPEAFEKLKEQFKSREVTKKYLALVHGKVEPPTGSINAPIERNPFNRKHFGVFPGGREALTEYRTVSNYRLRTTDYSLLEVSPHTGRTHQIRVHLKYINHPIVSDPLYSGRKQYREDLKICPRLFLHAFSLSFIHPVNGQGLSFEAPLPSDLENTLQLLK